MRIGIGYDVHKLVPGRRLVLGGVEIPYEQGLFGHSDADVLVHAVMDALLGAAGLPDIGSLFPDTDVRFEDADSMELLKHVGELLAQNGFEVGNIDSIIIAQKPKMSPYYETMKKNIASVLNVSIESVNIKAKTEEGLGFTGTGLGIAAKAVALVWKLEIRG
ncbi:MAG: 2-C-methyl-D-erythritol 2,4-cyclodiphosphate synthase [Defluviitaleaceae bacterium]|nr:2-C-methyl-D-erythritol 2,4-cyclodiphosphate synthase [Defluviitaleaceae bacterium]